MDWQPIETAPKDGTMFDVWVRDGTRVGYRMTDFKWGCEDYDFKMLNPGILEFTPDETEPWTYVWKKTDRPVKYWMPLPEPPK